MADGPVWLRVVIRAERALGGPLAQVTNSREGAAILLAAGRGSQLARDGAGRAQAALVHAFALPSHRDIERLDAKVVRLQRTLEEWSAEQREREP